MAGLRTLVLLLAFLSAHAVRIERNQFDPLKATNYAPVVKKGITSKRVLGDGYLSISGGFVVFLSVTPGAPEQSYVYYDGYDSTEITMTFADPVSAVGLDWISNDGNPLLKVFDKDGNLLENLLLNHDDFPINTYADPPSPYGFIGIKRATAEIAKAVIEVNAGDPEGNELFVGRWIYQTPGFIPDSLCERCNNQYRTPACQNLEKSHPTWLSVDIADCTYEDVDAIKEQYKCTQEVASCDTWVCTEHIPDEVVEKLSKCRPVIIHTLYPEFKPVY